MILLIFTKMMLVTHFHCTLFKLKIEGSLSLLLCERSSLLIKKTYWLQYILNFSNKFWHMTVLSSISKDVIYDFILFFLCNFWHYNIWHCLNYLYNMLVKIPFLSFLCKPPWNQRDSLRKLCENVCCPHWKYGWIDMQCACSV